ncbi:MAG: hypothetical protein RBR77_15645 [Thauera sp.]|jgi:hypothetical protein|nr:hypothetical protein [Thauera sp.]
MTHTLTREFDEDYSVSLAVTGHPSLHDLADIMQGWLIAQGIHYETAKRLQFVDEAEEQEGSSDGLADAYMLGVYEGSRRGHIPDDVVDALRKIIDRTPEGLIRISPDFQCAGIVLDWLETLQPTSKPTDSAHDQTQNVQGEPASGVVPSRDELIQCLLATRGQSEGTTADAILSMIAAAPAVQVEPVATIRHFQYDGIARNGPSQEAVMIDGAPMLPDGTKLYAAPQSAEPVKVPSDDLAHEIWAAAQTAPGEWIDGAVERIAALLARRIEGDGEPSDYLAHVIWAAAQTAPGEWIDDAVERIAALLARRIEGDGE